MANEKRLIDGNRLKMRMIAFATAIKREYLSIEAIVDTINTEDTVDAVEVKHCRWELHGNDDDCGCSYFCSNCHESYDEDWFYVHGQNGNWNYCPNCGAKMDGGVKNA